MNIKKLRNEKKISQQKLANHLNVSRSTVAMWETGQSEPDNTTLGRLAEFFNVSVDYLLGRTDTPGDTSLDRQLEGIDFALYDEIEELTDEQKQDILDFVRFTKEKRRKG